MKSQRTTLSLRGEQNPTWQSLLVTNRLLLFARNDERGNALWFILVAIGLLGLLTVMMSRSGSSTNETGSYEQNVIQANNILSYAKNVENGVQALLARGCSENELSFWHDSDGNGTEDASDDSYNDDAPTDHSCHIFDVAGAGMSWNKLEERWLDNVYSGLQVSSRHCINGIGDKVSVCQNNKDNDLAIFIFPLQKKLCLTINNLMDIPSSLDDVPEFNISIPPFTGSFLDSGATIMISGNFENKISGCVKDSDGDSAGSYFFYHVLHAR